LAIGDEVTIQKKVEKHFFLKNTILSSVLGEEGILVERNLYCYVNCYICLLFLFIYDHVSFNFQCNNWCFLFISIYLEECFLSTTCSRTLILRY